MKKILFILALFFTSFSFGQLPIPKALRHVLASSTPQPQIDQLNCNSVNLNGCNYISNPGFVPTQYYYDNIYTVFTDPFNFDGVGNTLIPSWNIATGSPTVWDGVIFPNQWTEYPDPPVNTTGYFFGATGLYNYHNSYVSESIVQKIPALTANHSYTMDFYKMYMNFSPILPGVNYPVDHFRIVLMHCSDYQQTFWPITFNVPNNIPANSQIIYCETTVFNGDWERVFTKFTPNQNYDMIWIYPETDVGHQDVSSGILVSFPELIDVTNFTAGPTPYATPPNCTVTLGPLTPNCYPTGALFTWYDPNGFPYTTPANTQQIQVNTSIPANIGVWTLKMTLPNVVTTNNSCSQNIMDVSASVNVVACGTLPEFWPKAYPTTDWWNSMTNDNNGNIILSTSGFIGNSNFYNHVGYFPPNSYQYTNTFQYTTSGVTNWIKQHEGPIFSFNSGLLQMQNYSTNNGYSFIDGTTGNTATPPINFASNELVIAETNSGAIITIKNNQFLVYATPTTPPTTTNIGCGPWYYKFNRSTNDLVVIGAENSCFNILHFDGTGLVSTVNTTIPTSLITASLLQIDNQNQFYYFDYNQTLMRYNYSTGIIPVNMAGFSNQNLGFLYNSSFYTEDKSIVLNYTNNYLYYLDFGTSTVKKVLTSNLAGSGLFLIGGNDVYLSSNNYVSAQIGNQNIPSQGGFPIFITKLNLLTDFSSFQAVSKNEIEITENSPSFKVIVSPNPTTGNSLNIKIEEVEKQSIKTYSINITNRVGRVVLQKADYLSNMPLHIGNLEKGIYYIEIINRRGERVAKSFVKL